MHFLRVYSHVLRKPALGSLISTSYSVVLVSIVYTLALFRQCWTSWFIQTKIKARPFSYHSPGPCTVTSEWRDMTVLRTAQEDKEGCLKIMQLLLNYMASMFWSTVLPIVSGLLLQRDYSELGEAAESMSSGSCSWGDTGCPPLTRFHFILRFWNHTLTWIRKGKNWWSVPLPLYLSGHHISNGPFSASAKHKRPDFYRCLGVSFQQNQFFKVL